MILVDTSLRRRAAEGPSIRVGMIGAGFMARGVARQIVQYTPGMELAAICNRHIDKARDCYAAAGAPTPAVAGTQTELDAAVACGQPAVTEDAMLLARAEGIDAVFEVTGAVEFAAGVVLEAIAHRKHVVLMDAELDGTIGPVLKTYADRAGVVLTNCDGDQPGVTMNLYRFVAGIGVRPLLCGNIKGLHDPYRNPTTQIPFARRWGQKPIMVSSFADGTKISFEQAIIANATGMRVARRGMWGPTVATGTPLRQAVEALPLEEILDGPGYVDYLVGAEPAPGVFVIGRHDDPVQRHYLALYKLGPGPLYLFYTPYHLCTFEVPNSIARAVLFGDAAIAPIDVPRVDVVAAAKKDLKAGEVIDELGGYCCYGLAENAETALAETLLPIGLAPGCRLLRDVAQDQVLGYADVERPAGRISDRLRGEQDAMLRAALADAAE